MTEGELITEEISIIQSGGNQTEDAVLRNRVWRASQRAADAAWNYRPMSREFVDGPVTMDTGADAGRGFTPSDFSSIGPKMTVWLRGQRRRLGWLSPEDLFALRQSNPDNTSDIPQSYTIRGQATDGTQYLHVYPKNVTAIVLDLKNYIPRPPKLVDRPRALTSADGGAVGLPDGAYLYAVTFETADGETEGGPSSTSLTVALRKVLLTDIAVSPVSRVSSRKIYRTAAGGEQLKYLATLSDNVTTTYLDNIADGDLGDDIPTTANAVSGLEKFPEAHHRTAILAATEELMARRDGDGRSVEFSMATMSAFSRMWASEQIQHVAKRAPRYGRGLYRRFP